MRKSIFTSFIAALLICGTMSAFAQGGGVYTHAGGGSSTADGVPATSAAIGKTAGICFDHAGNMYIADNAAHVVLRINMATGLSYKVAGTSMSAGFAGDGGPATAAKLNAPLGVCADLANNIYIADAGNTRIRKIDAATGAITTIAGGGASSADGVAATTAAISALCVYADGSGNVYTGGDNKVRKINVATGIINTVVGDGANIDTGDGGPAINASLKGDPRCITMDASGNMYIIASSGNGGPTTMRIRKVDAVTGGIMSVAGGQGASTAEDIPALCASLSDVYSCVVDNAGNIFVADKGHNLIRRIAFNSGIISTVAGAGVSSAEGIDAIYASTPNRYLALDANKVYFSNFSSKVRKFYFYPLHGSTSSSSLAWCDSFYVATNKLCTGPLITIRTASYTSGVTVKTWFGDGATTLNTILPSCTAEGYIIFSHTYHNPGTYTMKHVMYRGTTAVDSVICTHTQTNCNSMPIRFFFDDDADCVKDNTEGYSTKPVEVAVDSNGVYIDTIAITGGLYYPALGPVGSVYGFHLVTGGLYSNSCPGTVIYDTIGSLVFDHPVKNMGLVCTTAVGYDLKMYVTSRWASNQGIISVLPSNPMCHPIDATLDFTFSPKYSNAVSGGYIKPVTTTFSDNAISWLMPGVDFENNLPVREVRVKPVGTLVMGDTVHAGYRITPDGGDVVPSDNIIFETDTITGPYDPNIIEADRTCFDLDGTELQYVVHFENMGNDTAHNVYVMDTLSDKVDMKSLKLIASSAMTEVYAYQEAGYNIVKFDFPGIKLLDSSWHGLNSGMFVYTVKTRAGIAAGDYIPARVGIYFDFNEVVMTNTAYTIKGCPAVTGLPLANASRQVQIFPNPATDELTIKAQQGVFASFTITNAVGQQVLHQPMLSQQEKVSLRHLPAGVYYVTLRGEQGNEVRKFVKW